MKFQKHNSKQAATITHRGYPCRANQTTQYVGLKDTLQNSVAARTMSLLRPSRVESVHLEQGLVQKNTLGMHWRRTRNMGAQRYV